MLQDLFLHAAAREHEPMTLFLVNGVMLQGAVAGFDQFSLVLERGGQVQLVYKHAISTMQPGHPLNLAGETQAEDEG
jgi:host factor-I protein